MHAHQQQRSLFEAIGHRLPRRLTFGLGYALGGGTRYVIFLFPILPLLIGWNLIAGLCIAPINLLIDTVVQERIPKDMRARVFGTMSAGVLASIPLGTAISGYVVSWIGLHSTLIAMGTIYLIITLSLLINPALMSMTRPVQEKK